LPPIFPFFSYTALSILSERLSNFLHNFAIWLHNQIQKIVSRDCFLFLQGYQ
jgi:hypothetical protein